MIKVQEIVNIRLSLENSTIVQPQPPPKIEQQQFFQNIIPKFPNFVQYTTPPSQQIKMNSNQANSPQNITSQIPPNILNTSANNFQISQKQVYLNLNPQAPTPQIDQSK